MRQFGDDTYIKKKRERKIRGGVPRDAMRRQGEEGGRDTSHRKRTIGPVAQFVRFFSRLYTCVRSKSKFYLSMLRRREQKLVDR